jgi:hypothetical protein
MKRMALAAAISGVATLAGLVAHAQSPQCPCTYTLSQEQRALLQSMHASAVLWAAIRSGSARGTLDADAYEALRTDYDAVMAEIGKQDQAAAKNREEEKIRPEQASPVE